MTTTPRPETARAANERSCQIELAATVFEAERGVPSITATGLRAISTGRAQDRPHLLHQSIVTGVLRPRDHCLDALGDRRPGCVAEGGRGDARIGRGVSHVALLSA